MRSFKCVVLLVLSYAALSSVACSSAPPETEPAPVAETENLEAYGPCSQMPLNCGVAAVGSILGGACAAACFGVTVGTLGSGSFTCLACVADILATGGYTQACVNNYCACYQNSCQPPPVAYPPIKTWTPGVPCNRDAGKHDYRAACTAIVAPATDGAGSIGLLSTPTCADAWAGNCGLSASISACQTLASYCTDAVDRCVEQAENLCPVTTTTTAAN